MKLNILLAAILISLLFLGARQASLFNGVVKADEASPSPSDSSSPSASPSESPSPTPSESSGVSPSPTESPSPSESASASPTATPSESPSSSPSPTVSPSESPSGSPSSSPSVSPTSSPTPSVSPTPSPTATTFNLSGTVKKTAFFHSGVPSPAAGVSVRADNLWMGVHKSTLTDGSGHYSMLLNQGFYFVRVFDPNLSFFTPVLNFVNLNSDKPNVNFIGRFLDSLFF